MTLQISPTGQPALYHYTSYFGLEGILRSKSMWCSKMQYLNDSEELRHGLTILANEVRESYTHIPNFSKIPEICERTFGINLFTCSFCESGDLLSQWRGYAAGSGVAIGLSHDAIHEAAKRQGYQLKKCIYRDSEKLQITKSFLEQILKDVPNVNQNSDPEKYGFAVVQHFCHVAAAFKNAAFSEEQEWRLISPITKFQINAIKARATASGLIPYTEFSLKTGTHRSGKIEDEYICIEEVKIGPHRYQELQMNAVGVLADQHDACIPTIGRTSIPYRQF